MEKRRRRRCQLKIVAGVLIPADLVFAALKEIKAARFARERTGSVSGSGRLQVATVMNLRGALCHQNANSTDSTKHVRAGISLLEEQRGVHTRGQACG